MAHRTAVIQREESRAESPSLLKTKFGASPIVIDQTDSEEDDTNTPRGESSALEQREDPKTNRKVLMDMANTLKDVGRTFEGYHNQNVQVDKNLADQLATAADNIPAILEYWSRLVDRNEFTVRSQFEFDAANQVTISHLKCVYNSWQMQRAQARRCIY